MGFKVITAEILAALKVTFNKAFKDGLAAAPSDWKKVATEIKSTGATNLYGWLSKIPKIREWIGPRVLNVLKTNGYSLTNRLFEGSVGVARTDMEDDNAAMYSTLFSDLGQVAEEHIDENIFALLRDGKTNLCFDGQPFFDVDHPVYGVVAGQEVLIRTQSNLIEGGGTPWYLLSTARALKPLIYQNRLDAKLTRKDSEEDEGTFMNDEYHYGVRARRAFGYGLPQMAVMSTKPLNAANLQEARTMMRNMVTDEDRKLGLLPTLLVVPVELEGIANTIIKAEVIDGTTNVNRNSVEVLATPWVSN